MLKIGFENTKNHTILLTFSLSCSRITVGYTGKRLYQKLHFLKILSLIFVLWAGLFHNPIHSVWARKSKNAERYHL